MILGKLFVLRRSEYITIYRDEDFLNENVVKFMKGNILLYLGQGRRLDTIFWTRYGIVGWNSRNADERNMNVTEEMVLRDTLRHFDFL